MDKRILLLIAVFCLGSLAFFVWRKQFYAHSGIHYEIRPGDLIVHVGDTIHYQDKTEDASRWKWNFGDGEYSAEKAGAHTYLQPGRYPIELSVYGSFGVLRDDSAVVVVLPRATAPAVPEISGAASVNINEPVRLESNTSAESYEWEVLGEAGVTGKDEHGRSVAFSFTTPGRKTIHLTMRNPDLVLNKEITVNPIATAVAPRPKPVHNTKQQKPSEAKEGFDPGEMEDRAEKQSEKGK